MAEAVTHEDIRHDLAAGGLRFDAIESRLEDIAVKLEALPRMQEDIAATKEIVQAYSAVKTAGKFITWIGGIIGAIVAIMAAFKLGIHTDITDIPGP